MPLSLPSVGLIMQDILTLLIPFAYATGAKNEAQATITTVGGSLPVTTALGTSHVGCGNSGLCGLLMNITDIAVPIINFIAIAVLVFMGLRLILGADDTAATKAKMGIGGALVALIIINILHATLATFLGTYDIATNGTGAGNAIGTTLADFVSYLEAPAGALAVLMIVISGIRAVTSYGSEDGLAHIKRTIVAVLFGVFLIVAKVVLSGAILGGTPDPFIDLIVTVLLALMGLVTIIAVAIIIIMGIILIVNIGKDDRATQAKNVIIRVAIGLIVILAAGAIAVIFIL
ncbi:MAG: hypothetical protein V1926_02155 [Candidatus Peregrinibacteria bacterium]